MASYYWYKYNADERYKQSGWVYQGISTYSTSPHTFNESDVNFDTASGFYKTWTSTYTNSNAVGEYKNWVSSSSTAYRYYWYEPNGDGTQDHATWKNSREFDYWVKGSYISTTTGSYNYKLHDQYNSDGYWWVRGSEVDTNDAPSAPNITNPTAGVVFNGVGTITWELGYDSDGDTLATYLYLSTDGGSTYNSIGSVSSNGTSFDYDFSNEPATENAIIRIRHYDGSSYSSYAYSETFKIVHKVQIGEQKIMTSTGLITIPIYDPTVGMDGKSQLRTSTNNGTGCYELVDINDVNASPLRVSTSNGIKAIFKQ